VAHACPPAPITTPMLTGPSFEVPIITREGDRGLPTMAWIAWFNQLLQCIARGENFDKATFGFPGPLTAPTTFLTPNYTIGPLESTPWYATLDASQDPPTGADLVLDILSIAPDLDPLETALPITAVTYGSPTVITVPGHGGAADDRFNVFGVDGLPNGVYTVTVSGDDLTLIGSTGAGTFVAGTAARTNWQSVFLDNAYASKLLIPDADLDSAVAWPASPESRLLAIQSTFPSPLPKFAPYGRMRTDVLQVGSDNPGGTVELNLYLLPT